MSRSDLMAFDQAVPHPTLNAVYSRVHKCPKWQFNYYSDTSKDEETPNPALYLVREREVMDVPELDDIREYLYEIVEKMVEKYDGRAITDIIHFNFQITYDGHHGRPHIDHEESNYVSCLFFLAPEWDQRWGGSFSIKDRDGSWVSIPYIAGSAIAFDPTLLHTGQGARVDAHKLRLTCLCLVELEEE